MKTFNLGAALIGSALLPLAVLGQTAPSRGEITAFVNGAKVRFIESLKDPEAAKLRNLFASQNTLPGGNESFLVLCGEVNGKNSYGGYTGFKKFYSTGGSTQRIDDGSSDVFDEMYVKVCANKVASIDGSGKISK